jgi:hypothetical protein
LGARETYRAAVTRTVTCATVRPRTTARARTAPGRRATAARSAASKRHPAEVRRTRAAVHTGFVHRAGRPKQAAWPLPATLAALAVHDADVVPLARRLPEGTIGAALDPVAVLLVPDPDAPGRRRQLERGLRGRRAVLGPTVPWAQTQHSAGRALAGWPLHAAGRLGPDTLVAADDHLLDLLIAADERLTGDLVRRRLAPLAGMTPAARRRAEETLRAWLDAHGDVARAAAALHVHPQTVRYRLGTLHDAFGEALDDPAARLELDLALRAAMTRPEAAATAVPREILSRRR